MKWNIERSDSLKFVHIRLSDAFRLDGVINAAADLVDKAAWENGLPILIDISSMSVDNMETGDTDNLAKLVWAMGERINKTKIAILAAGSKFHFGMARQFQLKAEFRTNANLSVFKTEAEAVEWLTLPMNADRLLPSVPRPITEPITIK